MLPCSLLSFNVLCEVWLLTMEYFLSTVSQISVSNWKGQPSLLVQSFSSAQGLAQLLSSLLYQKHGICSHIFLQATAGHPLPLTELFHVYVLHPDHSSEQHYGVIPDAVTKKLQIFFSSVFVQLFEGKRCSHNQKENNRSKVGTKSQKTLHYLPVKHRRFLKNMLPVPVWRVYYNNLSSCYSSMLLHICTLFRLGKMFSPRIMFPTVVYPPLF